MTFDTGFGVAEHIKKNVVLVTTNRFEEHPEAYRPRVFVHTVDGHYEILQDGNAVPWTACPNADDIGPHWIIDVVSVKNINMKRPTGGL